MRYLLKAKNAVGIPGGRAFMLTDENGENVGKQQAVSIEQSIDGATTVTVRLIVDGETLRIAD